MRIMHDVHYQSSKYGSYGEPVRGKYSESCSQKDAALLRPEKNTDVLLNCHLAAFIL